LAHAGANGRSHARGVVHRGAAGGASKASATIYIIGSERDRPRPLLAANFASSLESAGRDELAARVLRAGLIAVDTARSEIPAMTARPDGAQFKRLFQFVRANVESRGIDVTSISVSEATSLPICSARADDRFLSVQSSPYLVLRLFQAGNGRSRVETRPASSALNEHVEQCINNRISNALISALCLSSRRSASILAPRDHRHISHVRMFLQPTGVPGPGY